MDIRAFYRKLQEIDINDIRNIDVNDIKKIGTASRPIQYIAMAVLALAILAGTGWFLIKPDLGELEKARQKEQELRSEFKTMQSKAARLDAYKEQLRKMRESFGSMLRQLPGETDMESLLVDLSQTSVAAGLTVRYFEPGNELKKDFYAEYPIELRVSGSYHQFGRFVSGLASLSRIVTLHDIQISPSSGGQSGDESRGHPQLEMTLTAKTYRYLQADNGSGGGSN